MTTLTTSQQQVTSRRRRLPRDTGRFLLLCFEALVFLAPVYWMVSTSLKPEADASILPVKWVPLQVTLANYIAVFNSPDQNILRWSFNSAFTATLTAFLHVALCTITAYPLARMNFKGRDAWFWLLLGSLMVPGIVTLIPSYIMMIQFNWIDTYHALLWRGLPAVFGVFLLRQFFLGLPRELEEAARLDGANSLQVVWYVIVPARVPALVTLFVFAFLGNWNDYVWPLFVVHGDMQTLPVGLSSFSSRFSIEYGKLMAATSVASIPVLAIYLFAQRHIEQGLTLGGLKE